MIKTVFLYGSVFAILGVSGVAHAVSSFSAVDVLPQKFAVIQVSAQEQVNLDGAQAFISELTQKAIGFLENPDMTQEQRRVKFRALLINGFDMKTLARFSLGRYWRQATPAQKKEYTVLFQEMVVDVYSQRFDNYKGQIIEVRKARPEGKSDIVVMSAIGQPDGSEIQVNWRVRYKDGRYRVVDVVVEGVSMALTQRSDFSSVIQRGGGQVEVLIAHLR